VSAAWDETVEDGAAFGPAAIGPGDDSGRSKSDGRWAPEASGAGPFQPAASSAAAKSSGKNGSLSSGAPPLAGVSGAAAGSGLGGRAARAARSSAAVLGGAGFGRSDRTKGAGGGSARLA
jgi:hypothetical protein